MAQFELNGDAVESTVDGASLLEALRELGIRSAKDGCAPQGQCGCCTVLVDGKPRVACVTPVRRVQGRSVVTLEGLDSAERDRWAGAFFATGASQCGFCSPGIIMRLEAVRRADSSGSKTNMAPAAHVCRCTGYQPILEAAELVREGFSAADQPQRDLHGAAARAALEGGVAQRCGPEVALGMGGFAEDSAPRDGVVLFPDGLGGFVEANSIAEARTLAGTVQGRNTTSSVEPPLELPEFVGAVLSLRTSWIEPAYLEPDCAWATQPEGDEVPVQVVGPLENGGAFGGKATSPVERLAMEFVTQRGGSATCVYNREEVVRRGPKRPPLAVSVDAQLRGVVVVAAPSGLGQQPVEAIVHAVLPDVVVRVETIVGPPVSLDLRGALWAELTAVRALAETPGLRAAGEPVTVISGAARATVRLQPEGISVEVVAGDPLDETTLRSYCIGAVHMAVGQVWTEGIAVGADGKPLDLTFRSFGLLRPGQLPEITVTVAPDTGPAVGVTNCVYAAALAAAWAAAGVPSIWPTGIPSNFERAR